MALTMHRSDLVFRHIYNTRVSPEKSNVVRLPGVQVPWSLATRAKSTGTPPVTCSRSRNVGMGPRVKGDTKASSWDLPCCGTFCDGW